MSKMNSAASGAATGAAVGGPWGAVIGGVGGYLMGSDDEGGSAYDELMKQAQSIPLPILEQYYPELYKQVVSLNPELETAINLGPSEMEGISTDPNARQAQLNALNKLQMIGEAGGRDAQFLSDQALLENDINTNLRGQQDAVAQNMATRGLSGGGTELVAKQMNAQNASNQQANLAMQAKAEAEQRALQALAQSGQLGGQMQAQDFSQAAQKAQASDAINKFNAQNQQTVLGSNVANKNNAQQWNAQQAQTTSNSNVDAKNNAQKYNLALPQQQFDNQLSKYGITSNAATNAAKNSSEQAARQDQFLGSMFGSAATAYAANNKKKE